MAATRYDPLARLHELAFDVLELAREFPGPVEADLSRVSMDLFEVFEQVVDQRVRS